MAKSKKAVSANMDIDAYNTFRDKVFGVIRTANQSALVATWDLGQLYSEFVGDATSYGKQVVAKLAQEMVDNGLSGSVQTAASDIYVSARIHRTFSRVRLVQLAACNMTIAHAKVLAALPSDLAADVVTHGLESRDDGSQHMVSTSRMRELIAQRAHALGVDIGQAQPVVDHYINQDTQLSPGTASAVGDDDAYDDNVYSVPVTPATVPSAVSDADIGAGSATPGGAEPFAGTAAPQGTHTDQKPDDKERVRTVASPIKTLADFEKALTRVNCLCADVILAADQADTDGFDGERALANFRKAYEQAVNAARELTGPLAALIESVSGRDFNTPG